MNKKIKAMVQKTEVEINLKTTTKDLLDAIFVARMDVIESVIRKKGLHNDDLINTAIEHFVGKVSESISIDDDLNKIVIITSQNYKE